MPEDRDPNLEAPQPAPRARPLLLAAGASAALGLALVVLGALQLAAAGDARNGAAAAEASHERVRGRVALVEETAEAASTEAALLEDSARQVTEGATDVIESAAVSSRRFGEMISDFNEATDAHNAGNVSGARTIVENEVDAAIDDVAVIVRREHQRLDQMRAAMARMARARRT